MLLALKASVVMTVQGTVTKVNTKTVVVDTATDGRWKVTASMLSLAPYGVVA